MNVIGKTKLGLDIILHPDGSKVVLVEQAKKIIIADEPDFMKARNTPVPIFGQYVYSLNDWLEFEGQFARAKKAMHKTLNILLGGR